MSETVCVHLSGPVLAFLLYENAKSKHKQEGFLLGDKNVIITKTVTDSESPNVKMHTVINVNSVISCPKTCLFYDNIGQIQKSKLDSLLGSQKDSVIGWYIYEPDNNFRFTLRERNIHKELSKLLSSTPDMFTCCLLSSSKSRMNSTYSYVHKFVRYVYGKLITVPLLIHNLGESSNNYKPKTTASKAFLKLIPSLSIRKSNITDWQALEKIQNRLQSEIETSINSQDQLETTVYELEKEICLLREKIEQQKIIREEKKLKEEKATNTVVETNATETKEVEDNLLDIDVNKMSQTLNKALNNNETINLGTDLYGKETTVEDQNRKLKKVNKESVNKNSKKQHGLSDKVNQKTDENIIDLKCTGNSSNDNDQNYETNLIDLTLTDEEENVPQKIAVKK